MGTTNLHERLAHGLLARRRPDGGYAASGTATSEVEPTAVAALASGDRAASAWLAARQTTGGQFAELDGRDVGPAAAALAALTLDRDVARSALRAVVAARGLPPPHLPPTERRGWGWTRDTRSLVEPTARVLIASRRIAPSDRATRAEAVQLLTERQCSDGGWNYGNATHLDVDLRSYAQTTAVALIALIGQPASLVRPGLEFLRAAWRVEPGVLTTAQALVTFRLYGLRSERSAALSALERFSERASFMEHPVGAAWAVFATGPDERLDVLRGVA